MTWLQQLAALARIWGCEHAAFQGLSAAAGSVALPARGDWGGASPAAPENTYEIVDGVAIIRIVGVLTKYPTMWTRYFGYPAMIELQAQVEAAAANSQVRSIALWIDSPGGSVDGTSDLADAIFRARQVKPVVAFGSDHLTSCAWYLASQANSIACDVDCTVGSIGVYIALVDESKAAELAGVEVKVVRSSKFKGAVVPGAPIGADALDETQRIVNELTETFLAAGARGRNWTLERMAVLADGRVHIGAHAQALGLVDRVTTFEALLGE